jgi:hypothetical protein
MSTLVGGGTAVAESIEVPGSQSDAVERFAQLWWESDAGSENERAPMTGADPASTVVIRAERV